MPTKPPVAIVSPSSMPSSSESWSHHQQPRPSHLRAGVGNVTMEREALTLEVLSIAMPAAAEPS